MGSEKVESFDMENQPRRQDNVEIQFPSDLVESPDGPAPTGNISESDLVESPDGPAPTGNVSEARSKHKARLKRCWEISLVLIAWITISLFVYDLVASYISYDFWIRAVPNHVFRELLIAWLVFTIIGTVIVLVQIYNTVANTIQLFPQCARVQKVPHQHAAFTAYYFHEIPKSIIFLIIMIRFSVLPDEPDGFKKAHASSHLTVGHSNYYKFVLDGVKMLGFLFLGSLEFMDILERDRKKLFMILNSVAATCHLCLLVVATAIKIRIEMAE